MYPRLCDTLDQETKIIIKPTESGIIHNAWLIGKGAVGG